MSPGIWVVLGAFWVIASFPAAVLIGRRLRRSPAPPQFTDEQIERLWQDIRRNQDAP